MDSIMRIHVTGGTILDYYIYFFSQCVYITLVLAIGVIVFNTHSFNKENFSVFLGTTFAVAGFIEGLYILSSMELINNLHEQISMPLLIVARSLPAIGLIFSFSYIKNNKRNWIRDILIIIALIGLVSIFVNNIILNIEYKVEMDVNLFFVVNIIMLALDFISYIRLKKHKYYFDSDEYKNLKYSIFIMAISRMEMLIPREDLISIIVITSDLLRILAIYYMYRFIVYLNLKKPYEKLSVINNELTSKTDNLKDNNEKLLDENIKIQHLKESLTSKESRLQHTLEAAVNGVLALDKNKNIMYKNRRFKEIFNLNENIKEKYVWDNAKVYISNYQNFSENIDTVLEKGKLKVDTTYFNNGKVYKTIIAPLVINSKQEGVVCILIDETKKQEFENEILEANERYENFLESIGDGIAVLDNKKVVYANKACKNIFKDEIYNVNFEITQEDIENEHCFVIDNKKVYVQISFSSFVFENKKRIIAVIRDITDRKLAQLKLEESEKSHKTLIDILPDGICLLDNKFKINYTNQSMLQMLKVDSHRDINNKDIREFIKINFEDEETFYQKLLEVFTKNKSVLLLEHKLIASDKKEVQVELNAFPFEIDNNKLIMIMIKDLTHKKTSEKVEKELIQRAKTDKVKTEFFANMSHELKTPLNVIYSSNQLLEAFYKGEKLEDYNDNIKQHIDLVKQNTYRLQRLINNIIDLTKMEGGFYKINLDNYNIISVVEDLFMAIEEYANKKDINIIFDTESEEKIMAIDKNEIERIILNLLSNCFKFTPNGGSIYVSIYDKENEVIISVKDSGMGIPKDKLDAIFDEFEQADKTLSRNAEGSGIGLAIVKNLVELHNGTIDVVSEVGVGTEFIITLPVLALDDYAQKLHFEINSNDIIEKIKVEFSDVYYY
jgi:PAS domain S-box-containing protein